MSIPIDPTHHFENDYLMQSSTQASAPLSKPVNIGLWIAQALIAAAFVAAGGLKLAGVQQMVDLFDKIGVGQWLRYLTGAIEVGAGLGLLAPRIVVRAALLLAATMAVAFLTHLAVIGGNPVPAALLAVFSAAIGWLRWKHPAAAAIPNTISR